MANLKLTDEQAASYAAREATVRQSLKSHRDGCPQERVEISQERGPIKIARCIDCGEQSPLVAQ